MAEKKVIEIDVNTKDAVKSMENLSKATHDVSASFEEVYGDLQPLTTRMGEAEDRLYELANAGKTTTKEYKDLLKTVGDYRKVQIKTDMAVDAAATTMGQKLGGALGGITSGFSIAQGAMGTFGAESALVEESLLKVQSAMAIQQGIQGVRESINSFKSLGEVLKANSIVQKVVNAVTLAYNAIMAANPVMAVVAGIAALIAIGYKLVTMFQESSEANDEAAAATKRNTDALNKQIAASDRASEALKTKNGHEYNMAKASGASAEALRKLALKHADEEIALEKATLATARNTYEKEKNTLANYKSLGMSDEVIEKQRELVTKSREALKEEYTDLKEAYKNRQAVAQQNQVEVKQEQTAAKNSKIAAAKEANNKIVENQKETNDKLKQSKKENDAIIAKADAEAKLLAIEKENEKLQLIETLAEQNYLNTLSDQERELLAVQDKYFVLETLATGNAEALNEIEIAKLNEKNDINLKYQNLAYDQDKAAKDKQAALDKEAADKKIEAEKAVAETMKAVRAADFANAEAAINLISGLFEGNKKVQAAALVAQNAVAIAKTIIETKAANQAARASGTALSIATGGASVAAAEALILRNNIGAGISIAAIAAATGKGLSALKAGGSPSGGGNVSDSGGGGGAGSVMSANFNVVGNSGINQLAQLQQAPAKAYVVSGDVTTAQALDRNRIENATLVQ